MKIHELINEVVRKINNPTFDPNLLLTNDYDALKKVESHPKLIIYVTYEFYDQAMEEIHGKGRVSHEAYEFYDKGTIYGFEVFRVHPNSVSDKPHPPFSVFEI